MAEVLSAHPPNRAIPRRKQFSTNRTSLASPLTFRIPINGNPALKWKALCDELKCQARYSCFFADGRKQEQARKSLESALDGKKNEFEKWNKEIRKREEMGGGGSAGRGGWFGGGSWFGGFGGDQFWEETQAASFAIIGIISLYLLLIKGNVIFVFVSNSILYLLRGIRNMFMLLSTCFSGQNSVPPPAVEPISIRSLQKKG